MLTEFITRYYLDPVRYDQPYNSIETLTYAIILILALYGISCWLRRSRISVDAAFVLATLPYIALGALVRTIYDTRIITSDLRFLLVTPLVYFLIFAITAGVLVATKTLENRKILTGYLSWYRNIGIVASLAVGTFLAWWGLSHASFHPGVILIIGTMATGATLIVWSVMKYLLKWDYVSDPIYRILIFGHMLDASATSYGIDLSPVNYFEEHVVGGTLISMTGTGFVMFPLKLAVLFPAVYILQAGRKDIEPALWYLVLFAMIVVGLGPGLRDMAQMVLLG